MKLWHKEEWRFLASGTAILLVLSGAAVFWLYDAWLAREADVADAAGTYFRVKAVADYASANANLPSPPADDGAGTTFLPAGTEAIQAAAMLEDLKQLATSQSVSVLQAESLPAKKEGPLDLISVSLQIEAPAPNLYRFLGLLRSHAPLYIVDTLQVRGDGAQFAEQAGDVPLSAGITVTGATKLDAATSKEAP